MRVSLDQAEQFLCASKPVAVPTETVYGLAARYDDVEAIQKVFQLKRRPQDNPLIVHLNHLEQLGDFIDESMEPYESLRSFFPGPLTIVCQANLEKIPSLVRAGLPTVALRFPKQKLLQDLIDRVGPLVAPSANRSGKPSATCAEHVENDFGESIPVLDGGATDLGVESTIIKRNPNGQWVILRKGAISLEDLQNELGEVCYSEGLSGQPLVPGQKYRHYAPKCNLILCQDGLDSQPAQAVLGFDDSETGLPVLSLGPRNDFSENLKRLYDQLRKADAKGYQNILVDMSFEKTGLGATLEERLRKASSK